MTALHRYFLILLCALSFLPATVFVASISHAATSEFENDEGISEKDLKDSIARNTSLSATQIDSLVALLRKQFDVQPAQKIPIEGYLYAHGMNGAFFVDHDAWTFDATIRAPGSENLVDIPDLFICDFHNGGLKFEVAYKWMFTFIPRGSNVEDFDGGQWGRGLGGVLDAFLGLEGSWMPAQNRARDLFHVAIKLGFGAGLVFPKMECKLRVKPAPPQTL